MAKNTKYGGIGGKVLQRLEARVGSGKSPRTLFLNTENYERLEKVCKTRDLKVSHVIDELIFEFIDNIPDMEIKKRTKSAS